MSSGAGCERFAEERTGRGKPGPEFAAHLENCANCRADLSNLSQIRSLGSAYLATEVGPLREKILRNRPSPTPANNGAPNLLKVAALSALVAVGGFAIWKSVPSASPLPTPPAQVNDIPAMPASALPVASGTIKTGSSGLLCLSPEGAKLEFSPDSEAFLENGNLRLVRGAVKIHPSKESTIAVQTTSGRIKSSGMAFAISAGTGDVRLETATDGLEFVPVQGSPTILKSGDYLLSKTQATRLHSGAATTSGRIFSSTQEDPTPKQESTNR